MSQGTPCKRSAGSVAFDSSQGSPLWLGSINSAALSRTNQFRELICSPQVMLAVRDSARAGRDEIALRVIIGAHQPRQIVWFRNARLVCFTPKLSSTCLPAPLRPPQQWESWLILPDTADEAPRTLGCQGVPSVANMSGDSDGIRQSRPRIETRPCHDSGRIQGAGAAAPGANHA